MKFVRTISGDYINITWIEQFYLKLPRRYNSCAITSRPKVTTCVSVAVKTASSYTTLPSKPASNSTRTIMLRPLSRPN